MSVEREEYAINAKKYRLLFIEFETCKKDIYFLIPSFLIWITSITVSILDYIDSRCSYLRINIATVVGSILIVLGLILRIEAKNQLGSFYSHTLKIHRDHKLITSGIYRYIRHPAYLGALLIWFGIPIILNSLIGFIIMLLIIPCYIYRMNIEEEMLIRVFKDKYIKYIKRSSRLIPYIY